MKLDCVACHKDILNQTKARYEDKGNYCDACLTKVHYTATGRTQSQRASINKYPSTTKLYT